MRSIGLAYFQEAFSSGKNPQLLSAPQKQQFLNSYLAHHDMGTGRTHHQHSITAIARCVGRQSGSAAKTNTTTGPCAWSRG